MIDTFLQQKRNFPDAEKASLMTYPLSLQPSIALGFEGI